MVSVRGIRGATTAEDNSKEAILEATRDLLNHLVKANRIEKDDVAAVFFTTTEDLNAEFPARAARQIGWKHIALICGHEMKVPDDVCQCIRVLILINTATLPQKLTHLYLKGAANLRDDEVEEQ